MVETQRGVHVFETLIIVVYGTELYRAIVEGLKQPEWLHAWWFTIVVASPGSSLRTPFASSCIVGSLGRAAGFRLRRARSNARKCPRRWRVMDEWRQELPRRRRRGAGRNLPSGSSSNVCRD